MAEFPYFLILNSVLAGNGSGTMSYTLPQNESIELTELRFIATGAFNITDIRDSSGNHLTNASAANPILSTMIQNAASPNIAVAQLPTPLIISQGKTFYVDVLDTSAAGNTVRLLFVGKRITS